MATATDTEENYETIKSIINRYRSENLDKINVFGVLTYMNPKGIILNQ
jgi:hypothetical protein